MEETRSLTPLQEQGIENEKQKQKKMCREILEEAERKKMEKKRKKK